MEKFAIGAIAVMIGLILGFLLGGIATSYTWEKEVVNHGYAYYSVNPQTGEVNWKWKDEK